MTTFSALAIILFLPWFLILGALFLLWPRQPRDGMRRIVDLSALVAALLASLLAMRAGYGTADPYAGAIWRQVLASLYAYGAFLGVLGLAWWLRNWWLARRIRAEVDRLARSPGGDHGDRT